MTGTPGHDARSARSPWAGLTPTRLRTQAALVEDATQERERSRFARGMLSTVPIVLVGSLAVAGLNLTGALDTSDSKPGAKSKVETGDLSTMVKKALANAGAVSTAADEPSSEGHLSVAEVAPSSYRVQGGDTVSSIAGRYGLSTASVLALNGLGWKSIIFPGQVLKLTNAVATPAAATVSAPLASTGSNKYTIATGDTVSSIASKFGVSSSAILSANGLGWSSIIYAGRTLSIPGSGQSAAPATSAPAAAIAVSSGRYTIKSGDTVTDIAKAHGVAVSALLAANNLNASSIIFSDQTLAIPASGGSASAPIVATAAVSQSPIGGSLTGLSSQMKSNARVVVRVGEQLGVPEYGIVIALVAAMQESSLRNISGGDRDSIGLFQQRPSTGWGTPAQLQDPAYASRLFYGGPSNPNKGNTRGLLDIANWQSLSVAQAAQEVQLSGHPGAYAQWESSARAWVAELK